MRGERIMVRVETERFGSEAVPSRAGEGGGSGINAGLSTITVDAVEGMRVRGQNLRSKKLSW